MSKKLLHHKKAKRILHLLYLKSHISVGNNVKNCKNYQKQTINLLENCWVIAMNQFNMLAETLSNPNTKAKALSMTIFINTKIRESASNHFSAI